MSATVVYHSPILRFGKDIDFTYLKIETKGNSLRKTTKNILVHRIFKQFRSFQFHN